MRAAAQHTVALTSEEMKIVVVLVLGGGEGREGWGGTKLTSASAIISTRVIGVFVRYAAGNDLVFNIFTKKTSSPSSSSSFFFLFSPKNRNVVRLYAHVFTAACLSTGGTTCTHRNTKRENKETIKRLVFVWCPAMPLPPPRAGRRALVCITLLFFAPCGPARVGWVGEYHRTEHKTAYDKTRKR